MGVHGLWELLAPVGRRVSVETLAGKKLAIDASIWMIQFMKAMRDEKGEMVRNAHILGFFRRICKLLFLRTKPVFVFDGGTPALKRRTVIARRRQRENAQAKVRKTAEKLLLNHLKAMKLKELAEEIKNQREKNKDKGEKGLPNDKDKATRSNLDKNNVAPSQEGLDAMLAASIASEEGESSNNNPSLSATVVLLEGEDGDEEMIIPAFHGKVDPAVFAALPQSMQDALAQIRDVEIKEPAKDLENRINDKGKKVLLENTDLLGSENSRKNNMASKIYNQEELDEMLAASIAEEEYNSTKNAMTSATSINSDYFNEDEEMILPSMDGKVDPAVLASLPPSMQLDLLGQMRERLMAENRQKYQKVKKAPAKFSELQIESYLKTVAFRREINQVQKSAAGRGVDGVQTSRIASEANREFIFSSSFTGDKQVLASSGMERRMDVVMEPRKYFPNNVGSTSKSDTVRVSNQEKSDEVVVPVGGVKSGLEQHAEMEHPSTYLQKSGASTSSSDTVSASGLDRAKRKFNDVETYLDDGGLLRVSRVRAMGIRMTRDLQRNLDLMKEVEHERNANKIAIAESISGGNENNIPTSLPGKHQLVETSDEGNAGSLILNTRNEQSMFKGEASIEICFKGDDEIEYFDGDDELFARLVAEDPISISSAENMSPRKQPSESTPDSDWEEGHIERKSNTSTQDALEIKPFLKEGNASDDSEVEWEEDDCVVTKSTLPNYHKPVKPVSRGSLEEVADLEEAIRRSLDDLEDKKPIDALLGSKILEDSVKEVNEGVGFPCDDNLFQSHVLGSSTVDQTASLCDHVVRSENPTGMDLMNVSVSIDSPTLNDDKLEKMIEQCKITSCDSETLKDASRSTHIHNKERQCPEKLFDASNQNSELSTLPNRYLGDAPHIPYTVSGGMTHNTRVEGKINDVEAEPSPLGKPINPTTPPLYSVMKKPTDGQILIGGTNDKYFKKMEPNEEGYSMDDSKVQFGVTEDTLEEEMLLLAQERISLGDEQRRFERNAESVSSEMFAECQELLQMFGLPYIIAPMEAEAQCAYMELANLVDGVVTDDSDVFLFGARSVYKNIFDDRKYVETYFMKDIENELGLTRQKLMRIAMLLGSDYTEGISGIGIVNAIEVVNAFPEEDGLHRFREWVESPDPTILGKFVSQKGSHSRKRGPKVSEKGLNQNVSQVHELELPPTDIEDEKKIFMDKHRNVSKNWYIPSSFPSEAVISAYASPQVDKSTEPFSWGKPNQAVLRKLCWEKFGWDSRKADDLLLPVLKEYNKHETQLRLEAFYTFNERFAKIRSKRIKKAVKGITGNQLSELTDDAKHEASKSGKKGLVSPQKSSSKHAEKLPKEKEESLAKSQSKQSRKRKIERNLSGLENPEAPLLAERKQSTRTKSKGGDRGRERGHRAGKGRIKGSPDFEFSETSSSDVNAGEEQEMHDRKFEGPQQVRKSGRSRKQVSYILDDSDNEDTDKLSDYIKKTSSSKEVGYRGSTSAKGACTDAAAGSDEKERHNDIDHSTEEEACKDYLEIGGGFCMAEGEDGDLPSGSSFVEGELLNEYRKVGGGFCIDEDEKRDSAYIPDTVTSKENAKLFHYSGIVNQDVGSEQSLSSPRRPMLANKMDTEQTSSHQTASSMDSSKPNLLQEDAKDDTSAISVGILKAMPSLRRKRRRG